jgi:hypothetical protein
MPVTVDNSGYPYLVGVLLGQATDEQKRSALSLCREHAHDAAFIADAARILEQHFETSSPIPDMAPCARCDGTGTYRQFGPKWDRDLGRYVNKMMTGPCSHCDGTGRAKRVDDTPMTGEGA